MVVVGCHHPLSVACLKGQHPMDLVAPQGSGCKLACSSLQSAGVIDPTDWHPDSLTAYRDLLAGLVWWVLQLAGIECLTSQHPEGFAVPQGSLRMGILLVHQPVG